MAAVPAPALFDVSWGDRSPFQSGLIESEQPILNELPGASVYHIDFKISEDLGQIAGTEEILYTNQEQEPLSEIYFRLFPSLARGTASLAALTVDKHPVEPAYELQNSAVRVQLPTVLMPGEQAVISMEFEIQIPRGEGGNYGTFGYSEEVLALAHFYPLIPAYDDEGWNIEIAPPIGDVVYADSSFYLVRVTAPATQTLVASGVEIDRTSNNKQQTVMYAAGPMRDFYLAASSRYTVTTESVGETTIYSYAPVELADGAGRASQFAVNALESFNTRFGLYPFTEFDMVSTTTSALGVEYPGIVALLIELYDEPDAALLESVVAHEVGHQWFYSVVGNDQVDEPWLDEALTQYVTLLYYADVYGPSGAAGFRGSLERRWARVGEADIAIGMPVSDYSAAEYSSIVYGRGPLFFERLAETMGPKPFARFLTDYYQSHKWGIATKDGVKHLAEQSCDCDLTSLFETWVYPSPNIR